MHIGWAFKCQLFHPGVHRPPRNTLHEIWNKKRWLLALPPHKIICMHISIPLSWFDRALSRTTEWWKVAKYITDDKLHILEKKFLMHCWLFFRQIWTQTQQIGCNKLDAMHCKLCEVSWFFVSRIDENLLCVLTCIEEHVLMKWEKMIAYWIWTNLTLLNII